MKTVNISYLSLRVNSADDLDLIPHFARYNVVTLELMFNSSSFVLPVNYLSLFNTTLNHLTLTGDHTSSAKATLDDVNVDAFRGLYQLKSITIQYVKCEMNKLSMMKSGSHHPLLSIEELSFRHIDMTDDILAGTFFTPMVGLKRILVEETNVNMRMINLTSLTSLEQLELVYLSPSSQLPKDLIKNKPNLELVRLVGFRNPGIQWNVIFSDGCPNQLEELYLQMGQIEHLSLPNCMKLKKLNLAGNDLKSIELTSLSRLQQLSLSLNQLETITINESKVLKTLHRIDLSHNTGLNVKSISSLIKLSPTLVDLNLNNIDFTDELPTLTPVCPSGSLMMDLCNIQLIPAGYFSQCNQLKFLSLDGNDQITYFDTSFHGLHSIRRIDCLYCNKRSGFNGVYVTTLPQDELLSDAEIAVQSFADAKTMLLEIVNASSYIKPDTIEETVTIATPIQQHLDSTPDWSELNFNDDSLDYEVNNATTERERTGTTTVAPITSEIPSMTTKQTTKPTTTKTLTTPESRIDHKTISATSQPIPTTAANPSTVTPTEEQTITTAEQTVGLDTSSDSTRKVTTPRDTPSMDKIVPKRQYFLVEVVVLLIIILSIVTVMANLLYRTVYPQSSPSPVESKIAIIELEEVRPMVSETQ